MWAYYYLKQVYTDRDELQAAEAEGREEGEQKKAEATTKAMFLEKMDIQKISKITGLPVEGIQSL